MKEIFVFADWQEIGQSTLMGMLRAESIKGEEIFSFDYDEQWLKGKQVQYLDPDLKWFSGPQFLANEKVNFGLFLDSSPDRWGRMLIKRREELNARKEKRKSGYLQESDFLLGVHDYNRMGALRFKLNMEEPYLDNSSELEAPPMTSIRELEQASLKMEGDNFFDEKDAKKWLLLLMAPGSSLGGARPKASVKDKDSNLWIAKFPSKQDEKDSGLWEFLLYNLASESGLEMAPSIAKKYSQKQHTFLTKRFDRIENKRIHFASAMTLLGYKDGQNHKDGGSYLELVEFIEAYGSNPDEDIKKLWKRIVFSVAVSNTDDHLRNHGFLLNENGWKLSPAYDLNPNENGIGLSLNISENDNSLNYDLCIEVAEYFRWKKDAAMQWILNQKKIISNWQTIAKDIKIKRNEIVLMEKAFRY